MFPCTISRLNLNTCCVLPNRKHCYSILNKLLFEIFLNNSAVQTLFNPCLCKMNRLFIAFTEEFLLPFEGRYAIFNLQLNIAKINILILHDCVCVCLCPASGTNSNLLLLPNKYMGTSLNVSIKLNEKQNIKK